MKTAQKIIEYIIYGLLVFVALLVLVSAMPIPGGVKTFIVRSGSMEPKIHTGSMVVVLPQKNYAKGDIVTFGPSSRTVSPTTHRIVSVSGNSGSEIYATKGDANEDADLKQINQIEVIGKVRFSLPYFGYIVAAAKKPIGFAVIIGIPALLFIVDQIKKIRDEVKRMREKREENRE